MQYFKLLYRPNVILTEHSTMLYIQLRHC